MNRAYLHRRLLALFVLCCAPLLRAAEAAAPQTTGPVITLPTVQVSSSRIRELDKAIAKLEKQIAREKKQIKSSELDRTLNNEKLANAAAIFGGNSASHLAAVAASRISLMEQERAVLESMKLPRTLPQLAELETELDQLRITRRNLDDAAKQR
ncbi:MAG TPA: hypothetical protein VKC51_09435 [Lacunisphaera sp.]|nr:hypothetical protein [Lacunisphaera sp.]